MRFKKITSEIACSFTISPAGPMIIADSSSNRTNPERSDSCFLTSAVDGERVYVIPGSSIKGVVRSYVADYLSQQDIEILFGRTKQKPPLKSKISFSDAFADMSTVETDIRYSTAITAIGQSAKKGSLNSVEAVVKGNFHGEFRLKNADEKEFLYIIKAINALDNGEICIGGRKSRGFGTVRIKDFRLVVSNGFDIDLKPVISAEYNGLDTLLNELEGGKISLPTEELYV